MDTPSNYIMSPERYDTLTKVHGFTEINGKTYQEHIIIIAGNRIPINLHPLIKEAKTPAAALQVLTDNQIPYQFAL